jgi:hypothetical protein
MIVRLEQEMIEKKVYQEKTSLDITKSYFLSLSRRNLKQVQEKGRKAGDIIFLKLDLKNNISNS